jgi:hypothetical protein
MKKIAIILLRSFTIFYQISSAVRKIYKNQKIIGPIAFYVNLRKLT